MNYKKSALLVLGSILALSLSGCSLLEEGVLPPEESSSPNPTTTESTVEVVDIEDTPDLTEYKLRLSDGRIVTCISKENGYKGGLDCDWQ